MAWAVKRTKVSFSMIATIWTQKRTRAWLEKMDPRTSGCHWSTPPPVLWMPHESPHIVGWLGQLLHIPNHLPLSASSQSIRSAHGDLGSVLSAHYRCGLGPESLVDRLHELWIRVHLAQARTYHMRQNGCRYSQKPWLTHASCWPSPRHERQVIPTSDS